MTKNSQSNEACLTDEDLYSYLTKTGDSEKSARMEAHFAGCPPCRQALADLIELLFPEKELPSDSASEPTPLDFRSTIRVIRNASQRERLKKGTMPAWFRWPLAAAIVIGLVTISFLGTKFFFERTKSEEFFAQAKTILDESYAGASPSNLRLALPFSPTPGTRSLERRDSLRPAENLLFQALALRENMVEAHLGLGYIYLNEFDFDRARAEFQKVLDAGQRVNQSLIGRGVAQYEEALRSSNPLQRISLLKGALTDFDVVLKSDPGSAEARYDKIWTLHESGVHDKALQEIEIYLARDSGSNWAENLRILKEKLRMNRSDMFKKELDRAAQLRDGDAIARLCALVPYRIPAAIWTAMRRSIQSDQKQAKNGTPTPDDLLWGARTMEASYGQATGDHSLKSFIDFYVGLSPPERLLKKSLEAEFQSLAELHQNQFDRLLSRSKHLETQYTRIQDYWQLLDLHHLRGNSLYLGKADFPAAETEFLKMHAIAERLAAVEPKMTALAGLALIQELQGKFDASLSSAEKLRALAGKYKLDPWQTYAAMALGTQYSRLGQADKALREYTAALGFACRLSDSIKILEALENSGIVMEREGRIQEADALYLSAVEQQNNIVKGPTGSPNPRIVVRRLNLLLRRADLALRVGKLALAEAIFQECLKATTGGMRELEARNRAGLAEVYLDTNRMGEAETMLDEAISISGSGQYWDTEWRAKFLKGKLLETFGRPKEALSLYRQSVTILERIRQNVRTGDLKQSFFNNRFNSYKAVVALLFKSGDKEGALEGIDRAKAATLKDDLTSFKLMSTSSVNLTEIESPVLEYFFTNDGLLIFFSGQGRIEASYKKNSNNELSSLIKEYLTCVKVNDSQRFIGLAQRLYQELIGPLEKYIFAGSDATLIILPDGPLHLLPFAGLMDGQKRFLIEKTSIAYAPSRSLFLHCMASSEIKGPPLNEVLLIDGTKGLPHARDELAYISELYGSGVLSIGTDDLSRFEREVRNSRIVHFSGHAIIHDGKPVLLLQDNPQKLYLDCPTIRNWKCTRTLLANLAGCSTGIGPVAEGEAPWGLVPAFLNAGIPAIIASLMPVDDNATKTLDCRFYDLLKSGTGKAKALQMAQLALLKSVRQRSDIRPQSWVPYILIGNPR